MSHRAISVCKIKQKVIDWNLLIDNLGARIYEQPTAGRRFSTKAYPPAFLNNIVKGQNSTMALR